MSWYARHQNSRPLGFSDSLVVSDCILCHVGSCLGYRFRGLLWSQLTSIGDSCCDTPCPFDYWFSLCQCRPRFCTINKDVLWGKAAVNYLRNDTCTRPGSDERFHLSSSFILRRLLILRSMLHTLAAGQAHRAELICTSRHIRALPWVRILFSISSVVEVPWIKLWYPGCGR